MPQRGASGVVPADIVICHHGVGGNFYSPFVFEPMGRRLLAEGCAVLRVNNRGHDLVYNRPPGAQGDWDQVTATRNASRRLGAAAEVVSDCLLDWQAWTDFALARGYRRIALWGHSLGAVKTIYFLATAHPGNIGWAIASSPPRFSFEMNSQADTSAEFLANLAQAERLMADGHPHALMDVQVPNANLFTPGTFIDKYGREDKYDIFRHLPQAGVPLLVTLGGKEDSTSFRDLAESGPRLSEQNANLRYVLIEGADHVYSGRHDELWAAAAAFFPAPAAV
jgi:pimeloyl-ACP methyl ester carboxylesterase